jgi:Glycosyltransferase family 87
MTSRMVRALFLAVLVGACAALALNAPLGGDYPPGPCSHICDRGAPPIDALIHGHLARFFDQQPLMGSFSLLLRAPFAGVAHALDGGLLWEYRLGAFPCLLAMAALGAWLWQLMGSRGQPVIARLAVLALCLVNPMIFRTLFWGHPEELLCAALGVAAIIFAMRGRALWAGVLLGLAIATKQWAILAVLPTLMAASRERLRLGAAAAVTAALVVVPMAIGNFDRFWASNVSAAGSPDPGLTPTNIWWPYGHTAASNVVLNGNASSGHTLPSTLGHLAHPLVILLGLALPLLYWRFRHDRRPEDVLALLALLLLARCLLDPLTYSYHHFPFLLTLLAWEGLRRRGLPVLGMLATLALWLMGYVIDPSTDPNVINRLYIAWTVPLASYLVLSLYFPAQAMRLDERLHLNRPAGAPA